MDFFIYHIFLHELLLIIIILLIFSMLVSIRHVRNVVASICLVICLNL